MVLPTFWARSNSNLSALFSTRVNISHFLAHLHSACTQLITNPTNNPLPHLEGYSAPSACAVTSTMRNPLPPGRYLRPLPRRARFFPQPRQHHIPRPQSLRNRHCRLRPPPAQTDDYLRLAAAVELRAMCVAAGNAEDLVHYTEKAWVEHNIRVTSKLSLISRLDLEGLKQLT
ncbi:hypothetical protein K432DRAFT_1619 [Lepidopterella palustris CBS 459.81]|uniref:Uncharacterized protein n=1 Tax=Lepidopterella palustris CBS 459.81 TaxID=1314670 RepID=A0A8E2EM71_9PEZI|nr:hypothetical protein K432DRAFT_1619 [Lepidopterella palustris CBS 459.81]